MAQAADFWKLHDLAGGWELETLYQRLQPLQLRRDLESGARPPLGSGRPRPAPRAGGCPNGSPLSEVLSWRRVGDGFGNPAL